MQKLFHFRRVVFGGLYLFFGVVLGWLLLFRLELFFAGAVFVLALTLLLRLFCLRNERAGKFLAICLVLLALAGAGALRFGLEWRQFRSLPETFAGEISGRVVVVNSAALILDRVTADGEGVPGRLLLYLEGEFQEGERLTFSGKISRLNLDGRDLRVNNYLKGVRYRASPETVAASPGRAPVFAAVRGYLRRNLSRVLDEETFPVGLALLTGNSGEMDAYSYRLFKELGILHIFAVSGLHFSILFGFLLAAFERWKLGRWKFLPIYAVLFFYAGVCNFSPSVLRSFLMISVLILGKVVFRRYDLLSGLFASVALLLLIQPMHVFSVGFALSVTGVLSICLLAPVFGRLFRFLPKKPADLLAVSFAAQVGLAPLISYYFGRFYTLSVLVNILLSYVVSTAFLLLFLGAVFVLPFPALGFLFALPQGLLKVLLWVVRAVDGWPVNAALFMGLDGVLLSLALIVTISPYVNLRAVGKGATCLGLCLLFLGTQAVASGLRSGTRAEFSEAGVLIRGGSETLFVDSGAWEGEELARTFLRKKIGRIDRYLPLYDRFLANLHTLSQDITVGRVCIPDNLSGEESGMLLYAEEVCGVRGELLEIGREYGGEIRTSFREGGGILLKVQGLRLGLFRRAEQEPALRRLDCGVYYTLSCRDYGVRTLCANCDGRHAESLRGAGELLFRLNSGIMEPIAY